MGIVYEAHDSGRGADVALKVLAGKGAATPDGRRRQVERFYREARALSNLNHPHIVRVYDRGELGGRPYFSMELVRGTTLRDRLRYSGPLSVPDLVRLALELCGALEYLHCRDVIHRDIKPENIMLLPEGSSKLMDFGVAQVLAENADAGGFHGSPAYMSPEQVSGRPVDGRSDLYALAVTLYEAATGRRAVEGKSIPEIVHRVSAEYPPPPTGLPFYIQGILLRAMAKDPALRYSHAAEMASDLRAGRLPAPPGRVPLPAGPGRTLQAPVASAPGGPMPGFPGPTPASLRTVPRPTVPPQPSPAPSLPATGSTEWPPPAPWAADAPTRGAAPSMRPPPPLVSAGGSVPGSASSLAESTAADAPTLLPGAAAFEFDLGIPAAQEPVGAPCDVHPAMRGIAVCSECRRRLCYGCYLETPHRGVLCRGCAVAVPVAAS